MDRVAYNEEGASRRGGRGGNMEEKRFIVKGFLFYYGTDFIMQSWTISPPSR